MGTIVWRNRNTIREIGGRAAGSRAAGDTIGIQTRNAESSRTVWARKCDHGRPQGEVDERGPVRDQTITTLKVTIAGTNRDIDRTVRNSHRGESTHRASHAGVPSRSSGAASMV